MFHKEYQQIIKWSSYLYYLKAAINLSEKQPMEYF